MTTGGHERYIKCFEVEGTETSYVSRPLKTAKKGRGTKPKCTKSEVNAKKGENSTCGGEKTNSPRMCVPNGRGRVMCELVKRAGLAGGVRGDRRGDDGDGQS